MSIPSRPEDATRVVPRPSAQPLPEDDDTVSDDEPPDSRPSASPVDHHFRRTAVRPCVIDCAPSLLTKALLGEPQEHVAAVVHFRPGSMPRRPSITSMSCSSGADTACDTAITSPCRTETPSPKLITLVVSCADDAPAPSRTSDALPVPSAAPRHHLAVRALEKKRCISFACAAKPPDALMPSVPRVRVPAETTITPCVQPQPKRPSIRFACSAQPLALAPVPVRRHTSPVQSSSGDGRLTPSSVYRLSRSRSPAPPSMTNSRCATSRRSTSPGVVRPLTPQLNRYLSADAAVLTRESSRFHEFASDGYEEDDWVRGRASLAHKITLNDALKKEMVIRKLGEEAQQEAEAENDDDDDDDDDDQVEDDDENADGAEDGDDDDEVDDGSVLSDGYNTDNEGGFASSDEEVDGDDGFDLWDPVADKASGPRARRLSVKSCDSSAASDLYDHEARLRQQQRARRISSKTLQESPDLPDSTDFVCGTLDEDRPFEEAYISHMEARKREKLRPIPQDIDPSFPTSDPEDEDGPAPRAAAASFSDDHFWELEDLDHPHRDRPSRGKSGGSSATSPVRRCRSPPPKKTGKTAALAFVRGRSPGRPAVVVSATAGRPRSTQPRPAPSPYLPRRQSLDDAPAAPSPLHLSRAHGVATFGGRAGLARTTSLPRSPTIAVVSAPQKRPRGVTVVGVGRTPSHHPHNTSAHHGASGSSGGGGGSSGGRKHVRGAIDIVKGLEQKRQRRRDKYWQRYCDRARKGQIPEFKPARGQGAERMREVGLLRSAAVGHHKHQHVGFGGNYILSV